MISRDQKNLSDYIKEVHLTLRRRARQIGAENAWKEHIQSDDMLSKYADYMKKLSENYWSVNNKSGDDSSENFLCRIDWIMNCLNDYYYKNGYEKEIDKEYKKLNNWKEKGLIDSTFTSNLNFNNLSNCLNDVPFKMLDVGSCFNPFKQFNFLNVYPIDLYPATSDVKKCDFLQVTVKNLNSNEWSFKDNMSELPSNFFNVVVFSLFLEYLPSPKQRFIACLNAYKCLKENGLLLIVTPDSKHASANASLMKNWKISAACIGFNRIRLEKLKYLYCMAFRKSIFNKYPSLLYNIQTDCCKPEEMFIIPQDSVDYDLKSNPEIVFEKDESDVRCAFNELPF